MTSEGHTDPLARRAHEELAETHADLVPTKPHNAYYERGIDLAGLVEPRPDERFREAETEEHEKLSLMPGFLCFEARKPDVR